MIITAKVLQFDVADKNGRVYSKTAIEESMQKFAELSKDGKVVFGELTHDGLNATIEDEKITLD